MPVISNLVYTTTESTIVATWTTDLSADSNLSAGGKAAIDNGVAANSTSHQAIVAGLSPSTLYSCVVTSGGTSSSPQNVTTNAAPTRTPIHSAINGATSAAPFAAPGGGDSIYTFVSSDNITYATMSDGFGFTGANNAGANLQLGKIVNETTFTGADVNIMSSYLGFATENGTDGPGGISLRGATHGPFGLNGRLFLSLARASNAGTFAGMGNVIGDNADHGGSWNRYDIPSSFAANGQGPATGIFEYAQNTYDDAHFVRYGADDGTLGYNSSGNQIDGANAYVYMSFKVNSVSTTAFLMRWPRIKFNASNNAAIQYWIGPASPTPADFVNDTNWSASDASKTSILTTSYNSFDAIIDFVPTLNRYVLWYTEGVATHGTAVWHFYEAPTPAGPWTEFHTRYTTPNGWIVPAPMHRDLFTNVATDNIALRLLYSGDFTVPSLYKAHFSTLTLRTTGMIQLITYGFTTVENPLSNGGNFTVPTSFNALKVVSSGVCEAAVAGTTTCGAYWSGAIPVGDTGGTWPADQYSEVTVGLLNNFATDDITLLLRQSASAFTEYLLQLFATTSSPQSLGIPLQAFVNGTSHALTTGNLTIAAGDVIRMDVVGNVITIYQNGVSKFSFTDTNNFVTAGAPGFGILAANVANVQATAWAAGANQAAAPTFSPVGGTYSGAQTVTLTGPGGSTIFYTTDGSTPTRSSSSVASGGTISVSSSRTVRAISSITNFADSQIAGATYTIGGGRAGTSGDMLIDNRLCTRLWG